MSERTGSARGAAVDALVAVLGKGAALDEAIARAADKADLVGRDRAFARALIATTLRRLGRVDRALAPFLKRPPTEPAHAILRVGAAQMLFLSTPAYAAVNAMTDLAAARAPKLKGLTNAVLRRVGERGADTIATLDETDDWPRWLIASWRAAYGAEDARRIAAASGQEAPLDLSVKSDPEGWAARLGGQLTPTGSVRLPHAGPVNELDGFAEGAWWVQDAAATLPARLLGDVAGQRVLDLCAAPGGKTLQLAAAGADVTAVDRSAARLARLRDNLARTGLQATVVEADALSFRTHEPFDAVLLDAPCSATGTLRRRPDVAWAKTQRDVTSLAGVQPRLIAAAAAALRPGGRLVYCTCSLQPEEGPNAVDAALAASAPLSLKTLSRNGLPSMPEAISGAGFLRTFPYFLGDSGGLDGFFAAVLTRT